MIEIFLYKDADSKSPYHITLLLEMDQIEQEPDFIALSRQFKATAMELISVLEQVLFELEFTA